MGLGFRAVADLPPGPQWGGRGSPELFVQNLIDRTPARLGDGDHASLVGWSSVPQGVEFLLHPAEEPFELRVEGDQLFAQGKTSSAGPGYHAFLIDWLERIAAEEGFTWTWTDPAREVEDELIELFSESSVLNASEDVVGAVTDVEFTLNLRLGSRQDTDREPG